MFDGRLHTSFYERYVSHFQTKFVRFQLVDYLELRPKTRKRIKFLSLKLRCFLKLNKLNYDLLFNVSSFKYRGRRGISTILYRDILPFHTHHYSDTIAYDLPLITNKNFNKIFIIFFLKSNLGGLPYSKLLLNNFANI